MPKLPFYMTVICLVLLSSHAAQAEYWHETEDLDHWNLSLAPGYSLLYVTDESETRHGFGARLLVNYNVTPDWGIDFKARLGIFDGDAGSLEGIYNQVSLTAAARYTISLEDWAQPYFFLGLGWIRTELNRETATLYSTHSLLLEPGFGTSFKITDLFWLGFETTLSPIFLGHENIDRSFVFNALISAELRI